ncbi:MAG: 3-methyl-2-oxobutanoate hydroxymethyltransferase [Deltaproteobacteria bacterium]|nr:3-methyl-2-oxobutanoate hydroxymethyltransferase [Deltaproteobacteria bacterium]
MKRLTILDLQKKKDQKEKLVAVTSYDATFASLVDASVDLVLVGDSLGMVIQGHNNTLSVSLEDMVYHTKAVARKLNHAHLVSDMPFLTYQVSKEEAVRNAGELLKAGAQSVKVEGGAEICETVRHLTRLGIPVMAHVGLTPQSVHQLGGFLVQGKGDAQKDKLLRDAKHLEEAGAYAVVLESIPQELALNITENLKVPTIGIGAGIGCDGQVLVIYDLLGMDPNFKPKFLKQYAYLASDIQKAVQAYAREVREEKFPTEEHSFH